jgi:hypothetical protein
MNNLFLNKLTVSKFPKGYGIFPYIIVRVGNCLFKQIPIHLNPISNDKEEFPGVHLNNVERDEINSIGNGEESFLHYCLLNKAKEVKYELEEESNKPVRLCLVEDEKTAYYFEGDKVLSSTSIPSHGVLLCRNNGLIAMAVKHYFPENRS